MNKLLICNHKMFLTNDEAKQLRDSLMNYNCDNLIICPSYINIDIFKSFKVASQDCFYEDSGAYTSLISAYSLSLLGVKYSLVGHFERRNIDSLEDINKKVKAIIRNSMIPILCIGDSKMDYELRRSMEVIRKQIKTALKDVDIKSEIIIAYEPEYFIGGKKSIKISEIEDTLIYIKKMLNELNIDNYKLVYGGSVNSENINKLKSDLVDGFLIGKSSTNINEISEIINCIK